MTRCSVRKFIEQNLPYTWFVGLRPYGKILRGNLDSFHDLIYFLKISVYTRYLSYSSTLLNFQTRTSSSLDLSVGWYLDLNFGYSLSNLMVAVVIYN